MSISNVDLDVFVAKNILISNQKHSKLLLMFSLTFYIILTSYMVMFNCFLLKKSDVLSDV